MWKFETVVAALGLLGASWTAEAADLAPAPAVQPIDPGWQFRMTPYAWLTSLNGKQTVAGRTVDVDVTFPEIVQKTIGDGGSLVALMLDMEARNGRFALLGDVIAEKITIGKDGVKSRTLASGISGTLGAALDMKYQTAIVEAGGAYEFAQLGPVAFDVLAGGRYWYQKVDVDVALSGTADLGGLTLRGNKAVARSGSVDWVDAFAGLRARVSLTPEQNLQIRADFGGGGSRFTWNALAAYGYDFKTRNGVTYSGVIGYKALYVDYQQGSGRSRYGFDMLQHGPVLGLTIRF